MFNLSSLYIMYKYLLITILTLFFISCNSSKKEDISNKGFDGLFNCLSCSNLENEIILKRNIVDQKESFIMIKGINKDSIISSIYLKDLPNNFGSIKQLKEFKPNNDWLNEMIVFFEGSGLKKVKYTLYYTKKPIVLSEVLKKQQVNKIKYLGNLGKNVNFINERIEKGYFLIKSNLKSLELHQLKKASF